MSLADRVLESKMAKLGTGVRFKSLVKKLSNKPGVYDPAGLAAAIGRRKLGVKKFSKLSHHKLTEQLAQISALVEGLIALKKSIING